MQFNLFTDYVNDNDGVKRHCDVWSERERESNVAVDRAGLVTQSLISRIRMGVLLTQRDVRTQRETPRGPRPTMGFFTSFSRSSADVFPELNAVRRMILPSDREPTISQNVNGKTAGNGEKWVHGLSSQHHRTCSKLTLVLQLLRPFCLSIPSVPLSSHSLAQPTRLISSFSASPCLDSAAATARAG